MKKMNTRFRGFLPVVIDIETGGLNPMTDALLEIAVITLNYKKSLLSISNVYHYHIAPYANTRVTEDAINLNKIIVGHPFRFALKEKDALEDIYKTLNMLIKRENCIKAVLVGHNSWFDLSFLIEASKRHEIHNIPLHNFTSFDTATLSALIYGQTVLSHSLNAANIKFNQNRAHSALYDAIKTGQLFCKIINNYSGSINEI